MDVRPEIDRSIVAAETINLFYEIEIMNCKRVPVPERSSVLACLKTRVANMLNMMGLLSHSHFRASVFSPVEVTAGAGADEDVRLPHTPAIKAMTTV